MTFPCHMERILTEKEHIVSKPEEGAQKGKIKDIPEETKETKTGPEQ